MMLHQFFRIQTSGAGTATDGVLDHGLHEFDAYLEENKLRRLNISAQTAGWVDNNILLIYK